MTSDVFVEPALAKLNLFLHVTGRREDGYHLLETLFAFTSVGDELTVAAAEDLSLAIEGPYAGALAGDAENENLVLRAAPALADAAGLKNAGARLILRKNLPVAAGLGGGSADAAAALRALNRLWGLDWPLARLAEIGSRLGADIPACVYSQPCFGRGIGTDLTLTELAAPLPAVLVNPGVPLATPDVFRRFAAAGQGFSRRLEAQGIPSAASVEWVAGLANDLEGAARACLPLLDAVQGALAGQAGARLVRMAGSGPTWFALFDTVEQAGQAATALRRNQPGWWVVETMVLCGQ